MALFLTEADVERLISISEILAAVEAGLREQGEGMASNRPRQRAKLGKVVLHSMNAGLPSIGRLGVKAYTTGPDGARFWVMHFDQDGKLLALMQADKLGQVRTGCASGVAARYLSRPESSIVGLIGTGWQARTQLAAVCAVRTIKEVRVYSRKPQNVALFCQEMAGQLPGVQLIPVESSEVAVRGADIAITITNSSEPVLFGRWLAEGTTILAAGSNRATAREVDGEAVRRCRLVVADSVEQAKLESGDLILAETEGKFSWDFAAELGDLVAGKVLGRKSTNEINMFKSNGLALEDVAAAEVIYRQALAQGIGVELPLG